MSDERKKIKITKVLSYITRNKNAQPQLLVFEHESIPEAGIQVPAGTVDKDELLEEAILREVEEEVGLQDVKIKCKLISLNYFHKKRKKYHQRNYFWLETKEHLPDIFTHKVTAGEEDKNMKFKFFWISIAEAEKNLADDQGQALGLLQSLLINHSNIK